MKKIILTLCLATFGLAIIAQPLSEKDKKFINEAAEGGLMEVKLGELAASKGNSEAVKTLGQHMVTDHTKANSELHALAARKNVTLPSSLSKKGQKEYDMLSKKEGAKFDKCYSKMMVKDHKKDVHEFKEATEEVSDAELKSWAANTLPTLQHHLDMSKETCDKVKKDKQK
jgi:putative membrane protein